MRTIANLFGHSPIAPLQSHMEKVAECVGNLPLLFEALKTGNQEEVERLAQKISELEHAADLTKNEIRNHLPKGLFMSVDRGHILELLAIQDAIADKAEDVGLLLTFRKLEMLEVFGDKFDAFVAKSLESFGTAHGIIQELDELAQSSFGGNEAKRIRSLVENVAYVEHEADQLQHGLLKILFCQDDLSPALFHLWQHILREIGVISDLSEKLANRVRMTLDLK
jgi:predicted phosphate transport protein (TIGR00153 family)